MNEILLELYNRKNYPTYPNFTWNFEKFHKEYPKSYLGIDYYSPIFNVFKRPIYLFYKDITPNSFYNSNVMDVETDKVSFHAEFDNLLFFYLFRYIKIQLPDFYIKLNENFSEYKTDIGYRIPLSHYRPQYTRLCQNPTIRDIFKFFTETNCDVVYRDNDDVVINLQKVHILEEDFNKYNFD